MLILKNCISWIEDRWLRETDPCEYPPAPLPIVKYIFPNWDMTNLKWEGYLFKLLNVFVDIEKCISKRKNWEEVVERDGSVWISSGSQSNVSPPPPSNALLLQMYSNSTPHWPPPDSNSSDALHSISASSTPMISSISSWPMSSSPSTSGFEDWQGQWLHDALWHRVLWLLLLQRGQRGAKACTCPPPRHANHASERVNLSYLFGQASFMIWD